MMKKTLYISIIDDDPFIRTIVLEIIRLIHFDSYCLEVLEFENGMDFFCSEHLDRQGKHFLILDGTMPMMDGIEVLKKLYRQRLNKDITVLMLSERKSEADFSKAFRLGADDYITKPFSIKDLQLKIEQLIKGLKQDVK